MVWVAAVVPMADVAQILRCLLWLWLAARAPIRPLAWDFLYAVSAALKIKKEPDHAWEVLCEGRCPCATTIALHLHLQLRQ